MALITVRTTSEEAREYAGAPRIRQGNHPTLAKAYDFAPEYGRRRKEFV
jgi:hypothetical protein